MWVMSRNKSIQDFEFKKEKQLEITTTCWNPQYRRASHFIFWFLLHILKGVKKVGQDPEFMSIRGAIHPSSSSDPIFSTVRCSYSQSIQGSSPSIHPSITHLGLIVPICSIWPWQTRPKWKLMKVNECGWMWMKLDEIGWNWMKLDESEWKWMKVEESWWKWMKVDESGRKWMNVDESGWKWMKVDENG